MLPRHCLKISSASRLLLFRNCHPATSKSITTQCSCLFNTSSMIRPPDVNHQIRYKTSVANKDNIISTTKPIHDKDYIIQTQSISTTKPRYPHKKLTSDELLEKLIASLSTDIHQKNRVYRNDLQRVINKVKEMNFSTKKQQILLIECCTELLPDEGPPARMELAEEIWSVIKPHATFDVDHYNSLLRVYIANNMLVMPQKFIAMMGSVKPNLTTYELIIKALAEAGEINQAMEVLSNMKDLNYPATETIMNSLILCQGKAGVPKNIEDIMTMMRSLKMEPTADTYVASARALAINKMPNKVMDELAKASSAGIKFEERHVMEVVKAVSLVGFYQLIPKILKYLPQETLQTPSISPYMQSVTTQLVFQNQPVAALEIYKCLPLPSFGPKDDPGLHGRSLVRDCVKANMPSSVITLITQELMASGRNPIAIQNAAEAALKLAKIPLALDLFSKMKQLGMPLRCHYFWPVLVNSSRTYGEKGIMMTLNTMLQMDVTPDHDTIMHYVLPYVSFTSPQNLMKRFQENGMTISLVLTPMMVTLLNTGQVRAASEICELFPGKVDAEIIMKPLCKGLVISGDLKSTVHILEDIAKRAMDKKKNWTGRFLCLIMKERKRNDDLNEFMMMLKALKECHLKISTTAADYCLSHLPDNLDENKIKKYREALISITDERIVDEGDIFSQELPHPKHMNEESLKAHLIELEAKGMNTRGVLRKLLQEYCRLGNLAAAREILDKCQREGIFLSAGMKAAIFDLHAKLGELDLAELVLADLNKSAPNFQLDEYKIIDLATLMVLKKKIDAAFTLITEQSKKRHITGGANISMNCWRLLDSVGQVGTPEQVQQMLDLLISLRYCKPTNTLLGPLIRPHLKNENLQEATNEFVRLANKYNKTPLKHELLVKILELLGDGVSEDKFIVNEKCTGRLSRLAQTILAIDKKVHGSGDVQLTLIAALADVGYKKTLRKVFLDPTMKFHPEALMRRCERFADEKKAHALEAIAECARDIRGVHVSDIYDLMLDVYQRDDKVDKALELWNKMQENDITPSQKFIRELVAMVKASNKPIPPELIALMDKDKVQAKTV